jgi:putative methionine-R-sulfoxide reductase with GAF domain
MPIPPSVEAWAASEEPWVADLHELADGLPPDEVSGERLPGLQYYLHLGIRSLLCFAITEDDHVRFSVVLGSQMPDRYGLDQLHQLRANDLEDAMRTIQTLSQQRRSAFFAEVRELFAKSPTPELLASKLVEGLAKEFDWDYVGIYRVERSRKRFLLVSQYDRSPDQRLHLDASYDQPLDTGMLGSTLREGRCLRADDVTNDPPHGYKRLASLPAQSALCYPVRVGKRIEWMIDCESVELAAFHGPDRVMLDELVDDLQSTLRFWFENRLATALLDCLEQSVVVVDADGGVLRANQRARDLLGLYAEEEGNSTLAIAAADESTRLLLAESRTLHHANVTLRDHAGAQRPALASARVADEAFGRWIWLFSDPNEQQWIAGLQYARSIAEQIAAQARGPLLLASALVKSLEARIQNAEMPAEVSRDLRRITKNLRKADITYERLVRAAAGKDQVMLRDLFERLRSALFPSLENKLQLAMPSRDVAVWGSSGELVGALTDLMRYLAARSGPRGRTRVFPSIRLDRVSILLEIGWTTKLTNDVLTNPLQRVTQTARMAAKTKSRARIPLSEHDGIEHIRWRLIGEGGDLIDAGIRNRRRRIEVRLRRVSIRGSGQS